MMHDVGQAVRTPVKRTMTRRQVTILAAKVRDGIAALGDPLVHAPQPRAYAAERSTEPHHDWELAVDVNMGGFTLPLCAEFVSAYGGAGANARVEQLADLIVARISEASKYRDRLVGRLAKLRTTIAAKLQRDGDGMVLSEFRLKRLPVHDAIRLQYLAFEVLIETLSDALRPCRRRLEAFTLNGFSSEINLCRTKHRERKRVLGRLVAQGAGLEIDAMTDHRP